MNNLLLNIKTKNKASMKKSGALLLKIEAVMVALGIILLIIDSNRFITIAVLLIFFATVFGIVTLFIILKNAMNNLLKKIANSVDIGYKYYIDQWNIENNTSYQITSNSEPQDNWFLIPSFANKSVYYKLSDDKIKMYHVEAFNVVSAEQRRTYYFKGLYLIMDGPSGDFQYRDKESISEKIIDTLKSAYRKDENDLSLYSNKEPYQSGTLYLVNQSKISSIVETLIPLIKKQSFVSSIRIGQKNNQIHIAITQKEIRLPYVRKYKEEELNRMKQTIYENLKLLEFIKESVSTYKA